MYMEVIIKFNILADMIIDDMLWLYAVESEVSRVAENSLSSIDCPSVTSSSYMANIWSKCACRSAFS